MIIWSGWGWLVPVAIFLSSLVFEVVSEARSGSDQFYQQNPWWLAAAMVAAGAIIGIASRALDRRKAKVLIEKETGKEIVLRPNHSFFFVPMRYWALVAPALGIAYALYRGAQGG
jgi:hypothetical protein